MAVALTTACLSEDSLDEAIFILCGVTYSLKVGFLDPEV